MTLDDLRVRDCMTPAPVCLEESTSLAEAYATLLGEGVHGAPVLDADGKLTGVVTVTDLLAALAPVLDPQGDVEVGTLVELKNEPLGDAIPIVPVTCPATLSLAEACRLMGTKRVHSLVVVDGADPVGVLSAFDAVRAIAGAE